MNHHHPPHSPFSAPFSKSARETGLRIRNLFQWKKKRPPLLALALVCTVVVCSGSLVSCQNNTHQAQAPDPNATVSISPKASPTPKQSDAPESVQSQAPDLNPFFNFGFGDVSWEEFLKSGARFDGNRSSNPRELVMDYTILNGTFTHTLKLNAGDVLNVDLSVDEGTLGVIIQFGDDTPIYQNENLETSQFNLEIIQSGSYQVTITGTNTKGSIQVQA